MRKLFWKRRLLGTYMRGGDKAGVIDYNGHFRAIVARLVKHPFREYHEYIWIFFEPRIQLPVVVLRLWGGAVKPLGDFLPMLS